MTESAAPMTPPLQAVLFDVDGVVTDTAKAHAAAWQRLFDDVLRQRAQAGGDAFRPFDVRADYRRHVDGMARLDGVRRFLASRGIALPDGTPDDGPDAQTVHGLGRRKDGYFQDWLAAHAVRVYPGTQRLLEALRAAGCRSAAFSASRNADAVLRSAGVRELFDVLVDGADAARLGLAGKPDPAMLREAASRLGLAPQRCAVVEDALAGVRAGAAGGFALVVGVDRGDAGAALRDAGAQLVVHDLAELALADDGPRLRLKTLANLPALPRGEAPLRERLAGRRPFVFLDYDGTLTPIVEDHAKALMADAMREAVHRLSRRCTVAVVSGRDLEMLQRLVRLDTVWYAGSHGFEIAGPRGSTDPGLERGTEFLPELERVEQALRERLAGIAGHSVERKRFSVAVHFRQVADADVARLGEVVDALRAEHPALALGHGKKVFELQPDIEWHKGHAVLWLIERLGADAPDALALYVGDDITDENAFRALAGRGLGIAVRDRGTRATAADVAVDDVDAVRGLLDDLAAVAGAAPGG